MKTWESWKMAPSAVEGAETTQPHPLERIGLTPLQVAFALTGKKPAAAPAPPRQVEPRKPRVKLATLPPEVHWRVKEHRRRGYTFAELSKLFKISKSAARTICLTTP